VNVSCIDLGNMQGSSKREMISTGLSSLSCGTSLLSEKPLKFQLIFFFVIFFLLHFKDMLIKMLLKLFKTVAFKAFKTTYV